MADQWTLSIIAATGFAILFLVGRIEQRVRHMKNIQARRSLEYIKIELELHAIMNMLILLSREPKAAPEALAKQRDRVGDLLRFSLEGGNSSPELLRGLELPDPKEDPVFGRDDIFERLGLQDKNVD